ncbi:MAG: hypothetical protein ACOX41_05800 [Anaerovoracaceae bacterium]
MSIRKSRLVTAVVCALAVVLALVFTAGTSQVSAAGKAKKKTIYMIDHITVTGASLKEEVKVKYNKAGEGYRAAVTRRTGQNAESGYSYYCLTVRSDFKNGYRTRDRVTEKTWRESGSGKSKEHISSSTIKYTYNKQGRCAKISASQDNESVDLLYKYSRKNLLKSLNAKSGGKVLLSAKYKYDKKKKIAEQAMRSYQTGGTYDTITAKYRYDRRGNPKTMTYGGNGKTAATVSFANSYGKSGRLIKTTARAAGSETKYTYKYHYKKLKVNRTVADRLLRDQNIHFNSPMRYSYYTGWNWDPLFYL